MDEDAGVDPDLGLPAGWTIELDPATRRTDQGRTLLGGAPFRILRLTEAGSRWLDRAVSGEPLGVGSGGRRLARRLVDAGLAVAQARDRPRHTMADVDVIIPTHDRVDGLAATLAALPPGVAATVVDDASTEADAVRAVAASRADVVRNPRRLGPGGARRRGIDGTDRPLLALIDANVVPDDGCLDVLLAHFDDPLLGAVAPRIVPGREDIPPTLAAYEAVRSPLDLGPTGAEVRPLSRVSYVPTTMLVVRRSAYDDVGGFDPELQWGEDVDLVWRLVRQGWRVRYEPSATAVHPVRRTWRAWLRQRVDYGSSAADLHARHGDAVSPLATSGWSALTWGLVLAGFPGPAAMVAAGTTAALVPKLRGLDHPWTEAVRIAGKGHGWAGRQVARTLWRTWWPASLALAVLARRTRPALVAALVLPALLDRRERRPDLDLPRYVALSVADDVAYGSGVWLGGLRRRDLGALLPTFTGPIDPPTPPAGGTAADA